MTRPNSVTARPAFTRSWARKRAIRGCKSTPRIASTARRAISRTRPSTSTGLFRKAEEDPILPICKLGLYGTLAGALILPLTAAEATREEHALLSAYVQARPADSIGPVDRASPGYATALAPAPHHATLAAPPRPERR